MPAFNHPCLTPKGPAVFIGRLDNGTVQVSRKARLSELPRERLERARPAIRDWSEAEIREWLKTATYCKNEIYPAEQVTA